MTSELFTEITIAILGGVAVFLIIMGLMELIKK